MKRILACDDHSLSLLLLAAFLHDQPYDLKTVQTGLEAITAVAREYYSLVLVDIMMPDMEGTEVARRIRQLPPPLGDVPIMAVTSLTLDEIETKCAAAGMNGCLTKPLRRDTLLSALEEFGRAEFPDARAV